MAINDLGSSENRCTVCRDLGVQLVEMLRMARVTRMIRSPASVKVFFWETAGNVFSKDRIWLDLPALKSH